MTRNGKIARLPRAIRDELNRRLDDGEPGICLVEWLNGLPEVKQRLASYFQGRPINKVNLTKWKKGGFRDWQARQSKLRASPFPQRATRQTPVNPNLTAPLTSFDHPFGQVNPILTSAAPGSLTQLT